MRHLQRRPPAETCALLVGLLLVAAGIVGFFYNGTFTSNERIHDDMLGAFSVNGWANALNVALGIWGLAAASSRSGARAYGYLAGLLLIGLAVWGFVLGSGQSILSIIPVNAANNWARLVLGLACLVAAVVTSAEPGSTELRTVS